MEMKKLSCSLILLLSLAGLLHSEDYRIAVIGDIQGTEGQTDYPPSSIRAIQSLNSNHKFSFVLLTGDVVHGEFLGKKKNYQTVTKKMWREFDVRIYKPSRIHGPVTLAPGNHDAPFPPWYSNQENVQDEHHAFREYWMEKKNNLGVETIEVGGDSGNYPYYYAYTYKGDLFINLLSTMSPRLTDRKSQIPWLISVLESSYRQTTKRTFVAMHFPPYPVLSLKEGSKRNAIISEEQVGSPQKNPLIDLLLDYKVDVLLVGHSHAPYPGKLKRKSDSSSIILISMPCAHAPRRLYGKSERSFRGYAIIEAAASIKIGFYSIDQNSYGQKSVPLETFPEDLGLNSSLIQYERLPLQHYLN